MMTMRKLTLVMCVLFCCNIGAIASTCEPGDFEVFEGFITGQSFCRDSSSEATTNVSFNSQSYSVSSSNIYPIGESSASVSGNLHLATDPSYVGFTLDAIMQLQAVSSFTRADGSTSSEACADCSVNTTFSFSRLESDNTPIYTFQFDTSNLSNNSFNMPFRLNVGSHTYEGVLNQFDFSDSTSSENWAVYGSAHRAAESDNVINVYWCLYENSLINLSIQELSSGEFITPDCRN